MVRISLFKDLEEMVVKYDKAKGGLLLLPDPVIWKTEEERFLNIDTRPYKELTILNQLEISSIELSFNYFLQKFKGWTYGDEIGYRAHLNNVDFIEYLKYKDNLDIKEHEFEKEIWNLATEPQKIIYDLDSIFSTDNNGFEICKALLEEYEYTLNGNVNTEQTNKVGRTGKLMGIVVATKEGCITKLDKPTELQILKYFNSYLGTAYKTVSKKGIDFTNTFSEAMAFIKKNFKK